ncbi:MAG: hypothetical protein AB8I08_32530 [Sandaracinaceae bacterium]
MRRIGIALLAPALFACAAHPFPVETAHEEAIPVALDVCAVSDARFDVLGAEVHERTLYAEIQDPGGWCAGTFTACLDNTVLASDPPQYRVFLRYVDGEERCASLPHRVLLAIPLDDAYSVSLLGEQSVILQSPAL